MTDKLKNKDYFDNFIEKLYGSQSRRLAKLSNNEIKEERLPYVYHDMSKNYLSIIMAKYSAGYNMFGEDVITDYEDAVNYLSKSWYKNHIGIMFFTKSRKTKFLKQYTYSHYNLIINCLSLGVLLNAQPEISEKLIMYIDKDGVKDYLIEFLISSFIQNRQPLEAESYENFFHVNERLGSLKQIVNLSNESIIQEKVKHFLNNDWYKSFKDTPIFNQHNNPHNTYSGYWCWVIAAIVKIKQIDSSSFVANEFYPKDFFA